MRNTAFKYKTITIDPMFDSTVNHLYPNMKHMNIISIGQNNIYYAVSNDIGTALFNDDEVFYSKIADYTYVNELDNILKVIICKYFK